MADMVCPTHARIQMLGDIKAKYAPLAGSLLLCLYKNALTPTLATPAATFVANECTFPGYARIAAGFGAIVDNGLGDAHCYSTLASWVRGAGGAGDSVGGIFLLALDAMGNVVMVPIYADFAAPVDMTVAGQSLSRLVEWLFGQYPLS